MVNLLIKKIHIVASRMMVLDSIVADEIDGVKDGLDLIGDYSVLLCGHLILLADLVKVDAGEHRLTSQD